MIYVGLDDTDMLDTPGTNHLARHLVFELADRWKARMITRHQLLEDPRVPCTRRNGCVAITFEESDRITVEKLEEEICERMLNWCPVGSDPGLCIATGNVPDEVVRFGRRCQAELLTQADARECAAGCGIRLRGLAGTEDGVIGALAAVGLTYTQNDGRVIYVGASRHDHFYVTGTHGVETLSEFGVDEVRQVTNLALVRSGTVDLGKRLRPNYRSGKVVLFVSPGKEEGVDWNAERVL